MSTMLSGRRHKFLTKEEILQKLATSDSELSDLSDDDDVTDKTSIPRVLEGKSRSDEEDDVATDLLTNVSATNFDLDRPTSSKSPKPIPQSSISRPSTLIKVSKMKKRETYQ